MQDLWCHIEHLSQQTPRSDQLTGFSQKAQGKFSPGFGQFMPGPGFDSMSPAKMRNSRSINRLDLVVPESGASLRRRKDLQPWVE